VDFLQIEAHLKHHAQTVVLWPKLFELFLDQLGQFKIRHLLCIILAVIFKEFIFILLTNFLEVVRQTESFRSRVFLGIR